MLKDLPRRVGKLVVILSNPPTTSGLRTLQRVELAKKTLGFDSVSAANLFSIPTYRTGGITQVGAEPDGWIAAREGLADAIGKANAVVLAYGCQEPSGAARQHFRNQLAWMRTEISGSGLATWMIDGRPRHPSRWHRHTHTRYPELSFAEALPLVLQEVESLE
jgi:hypothetical protein